MRTGLIGIGLVSLTTFAHAQAAKPVSAAAPTVSPAVAAQTQQIQQLQAEVLRLNALASGLRLQRDSQDGLLGRALEGQAQLQRQVQMLQAKLADLEKQGAAAKAAPKTE